MAFTTAPMDAPQGQPTRIQEPSQFDLPVKEFIGYDPASRQPSPLEQGKPAAKPQVAAPVTAPEANPSQPGTDESTSEPEAQESVQLSPKISALARKEAATRQRELRLQQREKELATKLADAEKYAALKAKIASKDYAAAEELGLTYEEYTQYLLTKQAGEKPEEQRFRKVEEELNNLKKSREEEETREYEANQVLWKKEIAKIIDASDEFSTIKELGAQDIVLQHINDSFEEDGVELTAEQAAKEIEDALVERASKYANLSKIKKSQETKVLGPPKTSPTTLTQNMTVTSQKAATKPFHLMSESEQIAEAFRRVQEQKLQKR